MVVSFATLANLINIKTKGDEKCVISIRNFTSLNLPLDKKKVVRKFYPKADHVVAVSEVCKTDMIDHFAIREEQISVIYNPYNIEKIHKMMVEPVEDLEVFGLGSDSLPSTNTIISVGRISEQKGFWRLIKAVALLKVKIPDIKLLILGKELKGTRYTQMLEGLIEKHGLEDQVELLGFKDNPYQYLYNANLYVLSSKFEGFPNGMTEAMACGLPIVSVNCLSGPLEILAPNQIGSNDVEEIYEGSYGILIPRYTDDELYDKVNLGDIKMAAAIEMILEDKDKAKFYQEKSSERVADFHVSAIAKEWLKLAD